MKEYRIQLSLGNGSYQKWCNIREYKENPLTFEWEARSELKDRQEEHPQNKYRIVVRDVTEWQEMK